MAQLTQWQAQSLIDELTSAQAILQETYTQLRHLDDIEDFDLRCASGDALHYVQEVINHLSQVQEITDED